MENSRTFSLNYAFNFNNQIEKTFEVVLDSETLYIIDDDSIKPPSWASMEMFMCPNCPLDPKKTKYCPLAKNLSVVIQFFQNLPSYQEVTVRVETNERITTKKTTVQVGVGSLMGIIMSCSGCPIIGKLRSLVRFHVPFAQLEETEYRVISMYVFAQYLKMRKGKESDWDLKELKKHYEQIQIVNRNIVDKLSDIEMNDTSRNAVVTLSNFAEYIMWNLEDLKDLQLENYVLSFREI